MENLLAEEVMSLTEAAKRLPRLRRNRPVHVSTLWRWATHGVRGVQLETGKIGGATVTSAEALRRFFAALSQRKPIEAPAPDGRRHEKAESELDELGIR